MVLHLSALLVTQVTGSQHDLRGVTSFPELGNYKSGYTAHKNCYLLYRVQTGYNLMSREYSGPFAGDRAADA
jgi:hypothetical protein